MCVWGGGGLLFILSHLCCTCHLSLDNNIVGIKLVILLFMHVVTFCDVLSFSFDVWVEILNVSVPLNLNLYKYLLNKSL